MKLRSKISKSMSPESFDGQLWSYFGSALSLNDRDEEALSAFEKALQFDLPEESYYRCLSEIALSFKRLGRYQEAIDLYKYMLNRVPETMLGEVLNNLATVYIENKQLEEAVDCLILLTKENPRIPKAGRTWACPGSCSDNIRQLWSVIRM